MAKNTNKNALDSNKLARKKYLQENYKKFGLSLPKDLLEQFKEKCKLRKTTPTTELKKFIIDFLK